MLSDSPGVGLPVNEVFPTVQGEARWTGTPAVFVRLQGCDVGCPWCDTKHTWTKLKGHEVGFETVLAKQRDSAAWATVTPGKLVDYCLGLPYQIKHLVVTGGEPAQYDLGPLCEAFNRIGWRVQLETSGTEQLRVNDRCWVTVSPKLNMPGGRVVLRDVVRRANELKMPIGKPADIERLESVLKQCFDDHRVPPPVWLQPLSQSPKATGLCVQMAMERGWGVSIQTHKYMGVR